jgi:hypothetical protein
VIDAQLIRDDMVSLYEIGFIVHGYRKREGSIWVIGRLSTNSSTFIHDQYSLTIVQNPQNDVIAFLVD